MKNSYSSQQISKTGNLDSTSISRQYKLNLKYEKPKLKQSEIANQLGYPRSTLQRYRNDLNMVSPHMIQPNYTNKRTKKASNTNFDNNSHSEADVKRPRLTSCDF